MNKMTIQDFKIEKYNNGDKEHFGLVYIDCYAMLLEIACKIVSDKMLAEDIVSEVFSKFLHRTNRHYLSLGILKGALIWATKNACLDHWRRMNYRKTMSLNADSIELTDDRTDQYIVQSDMLALIDRIIKNKMSQVRRSVFIMRFHQDMKYEDIAAALGIAIGTVEGHIIKGRKQIEKTLGLDAGTLRKLLLLLSLLLIFKIIA
jgi:RNA polymerase sigma-70 factor (ECF subfamily)